jgi:hypothetical protein
MKQVITCLALLVGLSAASLRAAPKYPMLDLDSSQPELIALLRATSVDYAKVERAGDVREMIARSHGSLSVASRDAAPAHLFSTVLPGNIVYWRAGSFIPATTWAALTTQTNLAAVNATGMILDLRSNTTPDDFGGALRIAGFLSKGQTGLAFKQASYDASTSGALQGAPMLVVLTNRETRGAAEILAAALQSRGALVMGEATEGKAAIFREIPLRSGGVLRYATAHVYLSNGVDLWDRPVVPDVTTTSSSQSEASALALIDHQQVAAVISQPAARQRMSEAALVRGQDPEQDAFIASHEQAAPAAPAAHDMALVEALDSFKAIRVLQGEESSPPPRIADMSSTAGQSVIASSGLGR